jgi:hypothetical protein
MEKVVTKLSDYTPLGLDKLSLADIANIIGRDWRKTAKNGIYFGAKPYLEAMECLRTINDNYVADSGRSIVNYFLANAQTWKGEVAKEIKVHLKKLVASK